MTAGSEDDHLPVEEPDQKAPATAGRSIPLVGGRLDSRDIFVGTREVLITHGRELYRLRLTAQNRLILTK